MPQQWQQLADSMTDTLVRQGRLLDPAWQAAFRDTPRHRFLDRIFTNDPERGWQALDHDDPAFLELAYQVEPIVTQLDGDPDAWRRLRDGGLVEGGIPSSSSSSPSLMAQMLDDLHVQDTHRVLEVGTGTGYNAAILTHRLGDQDVTSIDVDAGLVDAARRHLHKTGHHPALYALDAERTLPDGLFDRVEVTVAVRAVPAFWAKHLAPGGHIITALASGLSSNSLFDLHVDTATGLLTGRTLTDPAWFMPSRSALLPPPHTLHARIDAVAGHTRDTDMPFSLAGDLGSDLAPLLAPMFPTVQRHYDTDWNWLIDLDGSWVRHNTDTDTVTIGGPRDLWAGIETLWAWWTDHDKPSRGRIGLTVSAGDDQPTMWVDSPNHAAPRTPS
jgi:protein-L-isoaspartate(D-aspartate) O-methyltransferase